MNTGLISRTNQLVTYMGESVANMANDVYNLKDDGFEKLTKVAIANLKFAGKLLDLTPLFKDVLKTLEKQKDLIYATKFIGSACDFIDAKNLTFKVPTAKINEEVTWDWVKILYAVGNCLDTGKFLQKYGVFEFKKFSEVATKVGSYQVLSRWRFENIPVVGNLCSSPKDTFIFAASLIELSNMVCLPILYARGETIDDRAAYRRNALYELFALDKILKLIGAIGKMTLISCGRTNGGTMWFSVVDIATQNASLIKYWMDRSKKRNARFQHPGSTAAA